MIKSILLTTDFTSLSEYATEVAERIARQTGAKLNLLHVVNLPSHVLLDNQGELLDDCEMDNSVPREKKEQALLKLNSWQQNKDFESSVRVKFGNVNEESVKYACEVRADLIIMGSHGVHNYKDKITGSHTEWVAMHSSSPVLTIKSDEHGHDFRKIALVSAFQEDEIPNCNAALALQKTFGARICLLRINTPDNFLADKDAIDHMKNFAKSHGIEGAEYHVYNANNVEEGILRFAARESVDILMIGSHQRTGFSRFLQGCISADLINHAEKPLLTFPIHVKK
ncbi:MAG: universal stress protein [Bacteroidia bacterium]